MPSQSLPQAKFVPLPPNLDVHAIVEKTDNFKLVPRISVEKLKHSSTQSFEALVREVVIRGGKPLVIEGWHSKLSSSLLSKHWLEEVLGTKHEDIWDIANEVNIPMTVGHYLRSMRQLSRQCTDLNHRDSRRQRLYLKDMDCPDVWANHLREFIPESIYYLNECIDSETTGGSSLIHSNESGKVCAKKNVAPAGDLMSSLPPGMRALNLMCYIGHEGTYTAAHREMCATLGHNIMVETSKTDDDEKEGSSIWFMTETSERESVSEYFLSMLGHDIEIEKHFAQINAWKKAPFNVWVVEQKVGDLILIPPLAPHQVWNRGTRTIKVAWNRTTVDTLELALHEALPRCRMVCRDEQYKCKTIVFYSLLKYYKLFQRDEISEKMWMYGRRKQLLEDFKRLFYLYQEVIVNEIFSSQLPEEKAVERLPFDSNVICSYCRCDIFNRFLTCKACILHSIEGLEDTYDICMDCYAMGRSCACTSQLTWVEKWDWNTLVKHYELWRCTVARFDNLLHLANPPESLQHAKKLYEKKTIAEVCQEQLKIRSHEDISELKRPNLDPDEIKYESDDQNWSQNSKRKKRSKMRKARKGKAKLTKTKSHNCHICLHHEWDWKLAFCTSCSLAYCYGVLWRAFDLMPQTVMQDYQWKCPKCLKICSCGKCRKCATQIPYKPRGTLLGYDTKKVADHRSVERLVDFSKPNLVWLCGSKNGSQISERMKRYEKNFGAKNVQENNIEGIYLGGSREADTIIDFRENNNTTVSMNQIDPSLRDYTTPKYIADSQTGHDLNNINLANEDRKISKTVSTEGINPHNFSRNHETFFQESSDFHLQSPDFISSTTSPKQIYPDPSLICQNRRPGIGTGQEGSQSEGIIYELPRLNSRLEAEPPTPARKLNTALLDVHGSSLLPCLGSKRKRINVYIK
ncbi:hypothetical protein K3495_g3633 [Podosphaera aphanis]|nr:hypothetical protein K3495_g3633 [Podosphaera aphanis]